MSSPVLKVGDEAPEKMAIRLFGRPEVVSSSIHLRDTEDGFYLEYPRISKVGVVATFLVTYLVIGTFVWVLNPEDLLQVFCLATPALVLTCGILYAIDQRHKAAGAIVKFEATSGMLIVDLSVNFHLKHLEGIFDVRGDIKGGSCYRQVVALVSKPEGRFLYRLFHQSSENYIRDDLVVNIAKRLEVGCRVFDKVKFDKM